MASDPTTDRDAGWRGAALFLALFLALYAALAAVAELRVGRGAADSAFQKILAARGSKVDWIVLGASHALPLSYGDVPARHAAATGETMLVLAEPGAGPVYAGFVARQALRDLRPRRVLWILDPFTFQSRAWNADRVEDRGLLRTTPLRPSTARLMAAMVVRDGVDARALLDYLTLFSKLNNPRRFDPGEWEGVAAFDRAARPSRHAVASRIEYLYPDGSGMVQSRPAIDAFTSLIDEFREAGSEVVAMRLPLPAHFREALPPSEDLLAELRALMASRGVIFHDLAGVLDDPALYFDTDHLNRDGVDRLYATYLRAILANSDAHNGRAATIPGINRQ